MLVNLYTFIRQNELKIFCLRNPWKFKAHRKDRHVGFGRQNNKQKYPKSQKQMTSISSNTLNDTSLWTADWLCFSNLKCLNKTSYLKTKSLLLSEAKIGYHWTQWMMYLCMMMYSCMNNSSLCQRKSLTNGILTDEVLVFDLTAPILQILCSFVPPFQPQVEKIMAKSPLAL